MEKLNRIGMIAGILVFVIFIGCGGGGGGGGGDTTGGDPQFPTKDRKIGIVVWNMDSNSTTSLSELPISGQVIAVDDGPMPERLLWEVNDSNIKNIDRSIGETSVDANGNWETLLPLFEGDNQVVLKISGVPSSETFLDVTYNPGYPFYGQLIITNDVAYVDEEQIFTALIALEDTKTNPAMVNLYRITDEGAILVNQMKDNGDLSFGDEIAEDGIFSTLFSLNEDQIGGAKFRVQVGLLGGGEAWSEIFEVLVSKRLADEELEKILHSQSSYQEQLELAVNTKNQGEISSAINAILADLDQNPDVAEFGLSDSGYGVWVVYANGVSGVLYVPSKDTKRGMAASAISAADVNLSADYDGFYNKYYSSVHAGFCPLKNFSFAQSNVSQIKSFEGNTIKSNKAKAIAAQYWDWGNNDDIPDMVNILRDQSCFDVDYIQYGSDGSGSVEDFKALGDYGIVLISSHGDSFYSGLLNLWAESFGWNSWFGEVVLHSNMRVTTANKVTYEDDLKKGRLVIWGNDYGMLPSFIRKYSGLMPNSLVYMSICRGTWNPTLAKAFLNNGAGSFLGYDDYVSVRFCKETGGPLLNKLLEPDTTIGDAFTPGQIDPYSSYKAEFKIYGSKTLKLGTGQMIDGSFESANLTQAWKVDGDARIIRRLGEDFPTDGEYMAIISTGLGFTVTSGTLSQEFCLSKDATKISFDWNFYSEEFMEWVGSIYQDSFTVSFEEVGGGATTILLHETIDSLAGAVSPVTIGFDQGDVYKTGWRHFSGVIPENLRGKRVILKFFATDIGDSIYDTAVLIDNIVTD